MYTLSSRSGRTIQGTPRRPDSRTGIDPAKRTDRRVPATGNEPTCVTKCIRKAHTHTFTQCPHLCLHHGRPLCSQNAHRLEHVQHTLVLHPLQDDAQRDKDARSADAGTAVHRNRAVLAELLLGFVHLPDEVDEALAGLGNALLGPVDELELAHGAR